MTTQLSFDGFVPWSPPKRKRKAKAKTQGRPRASYGEIVPPVLDKDGKEIVRGSYKLLRRVDGKLVILNRAAPLGEGEVIVFERGTRLNEAMWMMGGLANG